MLKHSASCTALREYDRDTFDDAHKAAVSGSLGAQLQELEQPARDSDPTHPSPHPPLSSSPATVSRGLITSQGTLNLTAFRAEGSKSKASSHKNFLIGEQ